MASPPDLSPALRRPEVLAPAGTKEALQAAVRAGADAVYFGLRQFNARARAANFDASELKETLTELHTHGVKGYVTLNTLLFDQEVRAMEDTIQAVAEAGVDAVIVQDMGVARLVRTLAPNVPLHASTQMTCTDAASVQFAQSLGASRVILARELSLEDIAAIARNTTAELEVFVHGALCVAYSGQCLTSEAIGGRSANRGACAQACRLPYDLIVDGVRKDLGDKAYLLSPEDLEASAIVPDLVRLGIASLKIEGRLKGPEYVAATTTLYRRAIDRALGLSEESLEKARRTALQMYSRGSGLGFFEGVNHQKLVEARACDHRGIEVGVSEGALADRGRRLLRATLRSPLRLGDGILVEGAYAGRGEWGGRVWALTKDGRPVDDADAGDTVLVWFGPDKPLGEVTSGRRIWKTNDPSLEKEVLTRLDREPFRVPLAMTLQGQFGDFARLSAVSDRGARAEVLLDAPLAEAKATPVTEDVLRDKLGKLGDTPFVLSTLTTHLPDNVMVPLSSLNRARRALVEALVNDAVSREKPSSSASTEGLPENPPTSHRIASHGIASHETASHETASHETAPLETTAPDREPPPGGLFVLCRTLEQAQAAIEAGADGLYLDFLELTGLGAAVRALRASPRTQNVPLLVAPPRIRKPGEEKIDRYLETLAADGVLVRGLGALHETPSHDGLRIGDFSLNVTNRLSARTVLDKGLAAFTPSFDLDETQLVALLSSDLAPFAEVVMHHPMPLFHMEHCVFAALLSEGRDHKTCGRPCEHHKISLQDRAGMQHPVEADVGCRNTVFHAASQSAAALVLALKRGGVRRFRIELVREDGNAVQTLVTTYKKLLAGELSAPEVFHALRTEHGYGVVRGSLRVLNTPSPPSSLAASSHP